MQTKGAFEESGQTPEGLWAASRGQSLHSQKWNSSRTTWLAPTTAQLWLILVGPSARCLTDDATLA